MTKIVLYPSGMKNKTANASSGPESGADGVQHPVHAEGGSPRFSGFDEDPATGVPSVRCAPPCLTGRWE